MTDRNLHNSQGRTRQPKDGLKVPSITGDSIRLWIQQIRSELWQNIMPFWLQHSVDSIHGGFIGQMSNDRTVNPAAAKGLVLNARLLWAFSRMHRFTENQDCLKMANRSFDYILTRFWDTENGGAFWSLNPDGSVLNPTKKIYGQAFVIYAMSEYYRCTGSHQALKIAQQLFELLEQNALDPAGLGYFEVFNRNWTLAEDQRLGCEDMNEKKSMNNHLHLLEAFINLYRAWKNPLVAERLKMLLSLFCEKILNPNHGHLDLFFDETWTRKSKTISFGHDIETSWLLCEAAHTLNDAVWIEKIEAVGVKIAQRVYEKAIDKNGGLCYEMEPAGNINRTKEHWCQAEAAVGFLNAFQITRKKHFYNAASDIWKFIRANLVDREYGEWYLRLDSENRPVLSLPKISEWKDPYHNGRCCMELIERLLSLLKAPVAAGTKEALVYE